MLLSSFILSSLAVALSWWMGLRSPARSARLTAGMITILCISPALFFLPKITVTFPWASDIPSVATPSADAGIFNYLPYLWIAGSTLLLLRLLSHHLAARSWTRHSKSITCKKSNEQLESCCNKLDIKTPPRLLQSDAISSPVVTGLFTPTILLPKSFNQWSEETLDMVLRHELGHIQRRDLWCNMLAHLACALHWFNPLVWILKRRLLNECEFACDAHVISSGSDAKTYINALCDVAQFTNTSQPSVALAMAGSASLRKRVESLLAPPAPQNRALILGLLFCTASATFAVSTIRATTADIAPILEAIPAEEITLRLTANPFPLD